MWKSYFYEFFLHSICAARPALRQELETYSNWRGNFVIKRSARLTNYKLEKREKQPNCSFWKRQRSKWVHVVAEYFYLEPARPLHSFVKINLRCEIDLKVVQNFWMEEIFKVSLRLYDARVGEWVIKWNFCHVNKIVERINRSEILPTLDTWKIFF